MIEKMSFTGVKATASQLSTFTYLHILNKLYGAARA